MATDWVSADDLVSLAELGAASTYVDSVVASGRPKLVTANGVGVAVILDIRSYESLRDQQSVFDLAEHLADALSEDLRGELIDDAEAMVNLRVLHPTKGF